MLQEISAGSWYLAQAAKLSEKEMIEFQKELEQRLSIRYQNHWYPDQPDRGQAFRSLQVDSKGVTDKLISEAATSCGIKDFASLIKNPLVLFIDPFNVTVFVCSNVGQTLYHKPLPSSVQCTKIRNKKLLLSLQEDCIQTSPLFIVPNLEASSVLTSPRETTRAF